MATDDVTEISSPCLCGKGTITVTQTAPDHPWVRASQISYSATIDCKECSKELVVQQDTFDQYPCAVSRKAVEAREAASAKRRAAEDQLDLSKEAAALRQRIAVAVDAEPSAAARHRKLQAFGLAYESLATYRKRPYDGAAAAERARGHALARIGASSDLGGDHQEYFKAALQKVDALRAAEYAIPLVPVKTGARWMRA